MFVNFVKVYNLLIGVRLGIMGQLKMAVLVNPATLGKTSHA